MRLRTSIESRAPDSSIGAMGVTDIVADVTDMLGGGAALGGATPGGGGAGGGAVGAGYGIAELSCDGTSHKRYGPTLSGASRPTSMEVRFTT